MYRVTCQCTADNLYTWWWPSSMTHICVTRGRWVNVTGGLTQCTCKLCRINYLLATGGKSYLKILYNFITQCGLCHTAYIIVFWTLSYTLQWNFNQNRTSFLQKIFSNCQPICLFLNMLTTEWFSIFNSSFRNAFSNHNPFFNSKHILLLRGRHKAFLIVSVVMSSSWKHKSKHWNS